MTLSPNVSRPVEKNPLSGKPVRKSRNSPWGGMNMKSAQIHRPPDKRSQAEIKRSSGGYQNAWSDHRDERKTKTNADTFKALKMQRSLIPVSYHQRGSVKESIKDIDTFDEFDLHPLVKASIATQALPGLEEITPTPIQRLAIPAFLGQQMGKRKRLSGLKEETKQFLMAAETGSGKTLAYLMPVLDAIKRSEAVDAELEAQFQAQAEQRRREDPTYIQPPPLDNRPHVTTGRPRAIILLPTSELVSQVAALAKSLSHVVKFRSAAISTAYSARVIRNRLFSPFGIDLVICTPSLLSSITESDPNVLSRVTHIVVDEADSLLDRSFAPITTSLIEKSASSLKQLILCSATIPRSLDTYLRARFPNLHRLVTPNLHAIPRRVQLGVVDVEKEPYRGNRLLACADTIWSIGKVGAEHSLSQPRELDTQSSDSKRILVFVNEREKTQEVADYLQSKGVDAVALNRDTSEQRQSELLAMFTSPISSRAAFATVAATSESEQLSEPARPNYIPAHRLSTSPPPEPLRRSLPNTKVLVTTDLGSRGIDTLAVRHVILYDVPHSTIDFIHRLGRTGRMGRRGRGIVLVGKHDRRDVVREVREGMFRGQALI
jgi:ATP-dependent RNA helicase MRH4